ncbi:MAG: hypothetical protein GF418_11950, partial [Chitinivibrionales bacterium]|nr:hypothetical protein [Chitinivibrionales bacterium]MBD3396330.1 hypothetical protein [Chitinivibrionales bacterium]
MTLRAAFLGLLFAFFVSSVVYFNDQVIQQTYLIGNHFPIIVFGVLVILLLFINPLARLAGHRFVLKSGEIAVIMAMGLVVCGWPGSGFFRGFTALITMPSNMVKVNSSWQATHVMSYVPGASPLLGKGHIRDYHDLATALVRASKRHRPSIAGRIWHFMPDAAREAVGKAASQSRLQPSDENVILNAVNQAILQDDFYDPRVFSGTDLPEDLRASIAALKKGDLDERDTHRLNRKLVSFCLPDLIVPCPPGSGVLLADGDLESPAVQVLLQGKENKEWSWLGVVPWKTWWPSIFLWGGLAVLLGISSACLVIVFQPQWKRELLPYPIARFVKDITAPAPGGGRPAILSNKLFWYAFGLMVVIHLMGGLNAWFPSFVKIPLQFDFTPLRQLFPHASAFWWSSHVIWSFQLFPTVIAFAFFLSTEVSFSVGISGFLFMAFFAVMNSNGIAIENDWMQAKNANMLRFGAYAGMALVIFFIGRRYYLNVLGSSLGLKRHPETPSSAVWSLRVLFLCLLVSVAMLAHVGVPWYFGALTMLLILLTFVVITRINVETGTFFIQP